MSAIAASMETEAFKRAVVVECIALVGPYFWLLSKIFILEFKMSFFILSAVWDPPDENM